MISRLNSPERSGGQERLSGRPARQECSDWWTQDDVHAGTTILGYVRFLDDFPLFEINNIWTDTVGQNQFGPGGKIYAVQTANVAIQRCLLMCTEPGDLVLDPTCGSGTTAYVAEQWGRRWITIDTSRVPLALTRQRLLTATYRFYELQDRDRGPAGGFVYRRHQNRKGEEVGGIVPHVTLDSIVNQEPPTEEVIVDRPETDSKTTRVAGPFCVEATIPTPLDTDSEGHEASPEDNGSFVDRLLEVLRRNPVLQLGANRSITLANVRPPSKSLTLSAEATFGESRLRSYSDRRMARSASGLSTRGRAKLMRGAMRRSFSSASRSRRGT